MIADPEIHPVKTIEEVLSLALVNPLLGQSS